MDSRTLQMLMEQGRRSGMAGGLGSLGAGIAGLFGGGGDPYKEAQKYLDKIPGAVKPYLDTYINAGKGAMGDLQNQYGQLINDPGGKLSQFGKGYQQSPGYQWALNQGQQGINNAAAAGGMAGSAQHQQQAGQLATNMANQDYYNYLNHVMNLYGTGLTGEQDINHMGFNAGEDMAQILGGNLMGQANLSFGGKAAQNQSRGSQWGDILGGLGTLGAFGGFL